MKEYHIVYKTVGTATAIIKAETMEQAHIQAQKLADSCTFLDDSYDNVMNALDSVLDVSLIGEADDNE